MPRHLKIRPLTLRFDLAGTGEIAEYSTEILSNHSGGRRLIKTLGHYQHFQALAPVLACKPEILTDIVRRSELECQSCIA